MKKNIHPQWHNDCQVTCVCGNKFTTGSTFPEIQVEICASCHPFFTGEMKFVDTQGRVERFMQKRQESDAKRAQLEAEKKAKKKSDIQPKEDPKTFKQILSQTQSQLEKQAKGEKDETKTESKKETGADKKADSDQK